jgi:hypothetical protein
MEKYYVSEVNETLFLFVLNDEHHVQLISNDDGCSFSLMKHSDAMKILSSNLIPDHESNQVTQEVFFKKLSEIKIHTTLEAIIGQIMLNNIRKSTL